MCQHGYGFMKDTNVLLTFPVIFPFYWMENVSKVEVVLTGCWNTLGLGSPNVRPVSPTVPLLTACFQAEHELGNYEPTMHIFINYQRLVCR